MALNVNFIEIFRGRMPTASTFPSTLLSQRVTRDPSLRLLGSEGGTTHSCNINSDPGSSEMQGNGAIFSKFRSTGNNIQKLVAEQTLVMSGKQPAPRDCNVCYYYQGRSDGTRGRRPLLLRTWVQIDK